MTPLTREVTRGKLESFASTAQTARELFELYLSEPAGSEKKKKASERLFTVLATLGERHGGLVQGLKEAMTEDT